MRGELKGLLLAGDLDGVAALAEGERRVLGALLAYTYEPDGLLRWRAVEALGLASRRVAQRDPEFVRGILRRLLWSLSDESGGIGWSAPEAMGEIVAHSPDLFGDFAPIVASLFESLEEDYFQPGILWAIGRIAGSAPALVRDAFPTVLGFLASADPRVRGVAAWTLGKMGERQAVTRLARLFGDAEPLHIYEASALRETTVGELAGQSVVQLTCR